MMVEFVKKYKDFLQKIFRGNFDKLDKLSSTNSYIKLIDSDLNSKLILLDRLERINTVYQRYYTVNVIEDHLIQLANPHQNFWVGAYAELIGIDFLLKDYYVGDYSISPPELNKSIDGKDVLVDSGKGTGNFDIYFPNHDIYLDIKSYRHVTPEIINEIFEFLKKKLNLSDDVIIMPEYFMDDNIEKLKESKNEIIKRLEEALIKKHTSVVLDELELTLIINYGNRFASATSEYSPFKAAARNNKSIFRFANKFHKNRPFFIVYIISPYFSGPVSSKMMGNIEFYRSYCRRVFMSYNNRKDKLVNWNSEYYKLTNGTGEYTLHDASKLLTGIIFIEDNLKRLTPLTSYLYLNPNASNSLKPRFENELFSHGIIADYFDDFMHDNY
jgi:hypothetical protein